MRAYSYSQGKWQPCKDSLPATALSNKREHERFQAFEHALKQFGFSLSGMTVYTCLFGNMYVLARDHDELPITRQPGEPYDFLCILRLGGSYIRIWIVDLPDLYSFLTEIDARPITGMSPFNAASN